MNRPSFIFCCLLLGLACGLSTFTPATRAEPQTTQQPPSSLPLSGTVTIDTSKPVNTFIPTESLGAGVDGLEHGDIAKVYRPVNIKAMRSARLRPLTYRLRTELGIEAWHWNPQGVWSDAAHKQGYWTSSAKPGPPILTCYGYALPRRGSTIDQANNRGYSRLDDGDTATFWKSNPYLDRHFTGENDAKHPQWVMVDFDKPTPVNALRIQWGMPYATRYHVEYWQSDNPTRVGEGQSGKWISFSNGTFERGKGGDVTASLATEPCLTRYVRVTMTQSSHTAPKDSQDIRDSLGYAIREIYVGTLDDKGQLRDQMRHGVTNKTQTICYASSTDPWHRASDLDRNVEQPGFDRVFKSGLTNGLPLLTPVPLLYDIPENALAELRWLRARHYPVTHIEMGEEPDGQYSNAEDYASCYVRLAKRIHALASNLKLGGPCFQTTITIVASWTAGPDNRTWMNRFLRYLDAHSSKKEFQFFSFEWYPFDEVCDPPAPFLQSNPALLAGVLRRLQNDGLSRNIPWFMTEYGYSAFAGEPEADMAGALLNADTIGQFLTLGGDRAYFYGYEPNTLIKETEDCDTWGNLALWQSDDDRDIVAPFAAYYGACLLSQQWAMPDSSKPHHVYAATSNLLNAKGEPIVSAYALRRPDGKWAILLLNKDPQNACSVRLRFQPAPIAVAPDVAKSNTVSPTANGFRNAVDVYQYSSAQYVWHPKGENGFARPNLPPRHTQQKAGRDTEYRLPAYSLTILRGR